MKKTALEWYKQLPEPIRSEAIAEWEKSDIKRKHDSFDSLDNALALSFTFRSTPQIYKYWADIWQRARWGEFDQPTPNLHGWIPVGERLPEKLKDAHEFDIACGRSEMVMVISTELEHPRNAQYLHELSEWQPEFGGNRLHSVQFWQPMPKLPEVK